MVSTKTLIYAGCCVQTIDQRDTVRLWARVVQHLNPGIDVVLFDTQSVFDPALFLPPGIEIIRYPDNPGHLAQGGRDGAGRTFIDGILLGHQRGYDYVVHLESDMLLAKPVMPIVEKMHRVGVKAACPRLDRYQFLEWGITFLNVEHMIETKFPERYDWESAPPVPIPEWRIEQLLADDLFILPLRGMRNDGNWVNSLTLPNHYPYQPPDFITHCSEFGVYHRFLDINGIDIQPERV